MRTTVFQQANMLAFLVLDEVNNVQTSIQEALLLLANEKENEKNAPPPTKNGANLI